MCFSFLSSFKKYVVSLSFLVVFLAPIMLFAQQSTPSSNLPDNQLGEDKFIVTSSQIADASLLLPHPTVTQTVTIPLTPSTVITGNHIVFLPTIMNNYVDYFDDFSNPASGWPIADTSVNIYQYNDGEYQILNKTNAYIGAATVGNRLIDFEMSVEMRRNGTARGAYGFIFGLDDTWSEYYMFLIWPDSQETSLYRFREGIGFTRLSLLSPRSCIKQGNETNDIRFTQYRVFGWFGTIFERTVYVNGDCVISNLSVDFTDARRVGLVAVPIDAGHDVRFDNYRFKNHPTVNGG